MVAFMDAAALAATRATGLAHFHSRSRGRLWKKGETSGHILKVQRMLVDCDQDSLVLECDPAGLEYMPKTASPVKILASLDGKSFAPAPLTRRVKLANGKTVVREIPVAEYRALRWSIGALGSDASRTVVARMRVAPLEAVATAVPAR